MIREQRARRLQLFPNVRAALEAGRISAEQADLLTEAGLDRDIVDQLLKLATRHGDADQTRADVQAARAKADEDDPDKALRRLIAARRGGWGFNPDGSFWINAKLDPLTAALLSAELDRLERQEFQTHDKLAGLHARTPGQRRADVLALLLGGTPPGRENEPAPKPNTNSRSGAKTVLHLIRRDTDATRPDGVAHTMNGTPIPVSTVAGLFDTAEIHAWRISCTSDLIGHSTGHRHATKTQRLALAIRHGTCVWHGCNRAASGCDAHHMTEWHLTHDSRLINLTLLCPQHHHQLHQMGGTLSPDPASTNGWQITHLTTGSVERVISRWEKPPPAWLRPDDEEVDPQPGEPPPHFGAGAE